MADTSLNNFLKISRGDKLEVVAQPLSGASEFYFLNFMCLLCGLEGDSSGGNVSAKIRLSQNRPIVPWLLY